MGKMLEVFCLQMFFVGISESGEALQRLIKWGTLSLSEVVETEG